MMPIMHCEIEFIPSPHLSQIYEGFYRLAKKKLITTSIISKKNSICPIMKVKLLFDSKKTLLLYYDTLDGFNWLDNASTKENLMHFRNEFKADFYFKRSYNKELVEYAPQNCTVLPLGLNYYIESKHNFGSPLNIKLKKLIKYIIPKKYHGGVLHAEDFEYPPFLSNHSREILFLTRLWNPEDVEDSNLKIERKELNDYRIECIQACQREFSSILTCGLIQDDFATSYARHLIARNDITKRSNFVDAIKCHNICIATEGLHGSIGWKLAEYVAGSRAIISEPMRYIPVGEFKKKYNYLEFKNIKELQENIQFFLDNKRKILNMMYNNFMYYNMYLKPENLVLNTILSACSGQNEKSVVHL